MVPGVFRMQMCILSSLYILTYLPGSYASSPHRIRRYLECLGEILDGLDGFWWRVWVRDVSRMGFRMVLGWYLDGLGLILMDLEVCLDCFWMDCLMLWGRLLMYGPWMLMDFE